MGATLEELAGDIHMTNVEKGFWEEPEMMDKFVARIMLVVTETSELTEALRKVQGREAVLDELADIFIRTLDLYETFKEYGLVEPDASISAAIDSKMERNRERPHKHAHIWG